MTQTQELNTKKAILRSLLTCPHGKLAETVPVFGEAMQRDPLFTGKALYALTLEEFNRIRDLEEAGIAFLLTSPHDVHREAGRVTFQTLEPYRAGRVALFVHRHLKANRQVRGAVDDYLKTLSWNRKRFDGAARLARRELHQMYELYHLKPSERAQRVLFDGKVPEGEVDVSRLLREAPTAEAQARLIVEHRVPYTLATSALKSMAPAVWVALIEVMTPAEALNLRAAVEKSGILIDPEIRELYEAKLAQVKYTERAQVSTMTERKSAQGRDERLTKIVGEARQAKIDQSAKITLDTLICVDCSGSMESAIELAQRLCPHVAALCDETLRVYCFNDTAWLLEAKGTSFEDYQRAFALIRANGYTSLGAPLEMSLKRGFCPEMVIYITDQGENRHPSVVNLYRDQEALKSTRFVFVNVGQVSHAVALTMETGGADVVEFDAQVPANEKGWFAVLDNLTPLLTKGGYRELVERIMALELPRRGK